MTTLGRGCLLTLLLLVAALGLRRRRRVVWDDKPDVDFGTYDPWLERARCR